MKGENLVAEVENHFLKLGFGIVREDRLRQARDDEIGAPRTCSCSSSCSCSCSAELV